MNTLSKTKPEGLGNVTSTLLQNKGPSYCEAIRDFLLRSVGQTEVLALEAVRWQNIVNYSAVQRSRFVSVT